VTTRILQKCYAEWGFKLMTMCVRPSMFYPDVFVRGK